MLQRNPFFIKCFLYYLIQWCSGKIFLQIFKHPMHIVPWPALQDSVIKHVYTSLVLQCVEIPEPKYFSSFRVCGENIRSCQNLTLPLVTPSLIRFAVCWSFTLSLSLSVFPDTEQKCQNFLPIVIIAKIKMFCKLEYSFMILLYLL